MKKDLFDELIVVKRSGQRVNFNNYKIAVAIKNAFDNILDIYTEKDINIIYESVLLYIENNYMDRKTINVEDIQDIIENILKDNGYKISEFLEPSAGAGVFSNYLATSGLDVVAIDIEPDSEDIIKADYLEYPL